MFAHLNNSCLGRSDTALFERGQFSSGPGRSSRQLPSTEVYHTELNAYTERMPHRTMPCLFECNMLFNLTYGCSGRCLCAFGKKPLSLYHPPCPTRHYHGGAVVNHRCPTKVVFQNLKQAPTSSTNVRFLWRHVQGFNGLINDGPM